MQRKTFSILFAAALIATALPAVTRAQEWQTNGNHIYNTNTGNVGIGTQNPSEKLHVQGGDVLVESGSGAELNLLNLTTGVQWQVVSGINGGIELGNVTDGLTNTLAPLFIWQDGRVRVGTTNAGTAQFAVMGGSLGVGTVNPAKKLHVMGDAQIESSGGAELNLLNTTSASQWQVVSGFNAGFEVGYVTGGLTDSAAPLFVATTGNVGLGTVNPSEKLTVEGNLKVNGSIVSDGDICIGSGCP
jgi:hypothetical protein